MININTAIRALKWSAIFFLSVLVLFLASLLIALRPGTPTEIPIVTFHYSNAIDCYLCSSDEKSKILPTWHTELKEYLPFLENEWNKFGPRFLDATSKLIGKPFSYPKFDIPIFLCPNLPGTGLPLMVPVRMYLKSAVTEKPWGRSEFVDMVYHEMLHVYIARALHWNLWTPLLIKYRHEDLNTKIHLHLFAVQKAVYFNLGMEKRWQIVVARNKEFPPQYSRAINIIEKEGYQPFINELKN